MWFHHVTSYFILIIHVCPNDQVEALSVLLTICGECGYFYSDRITVLIAKVFLPALTFSLSQGVTHLTLTVSVSHFSGEMTMKKVCCLFIYLLSDAYSFCRVSLIQIIFCFIQKNWNNIFQDYVPLEAAVACTENVDPIPLSNASYTL